MGFTLQELEHFIALSKAIEDQKVGYKQSTERTEQKEKLVEIINIDQELNLIEQKILKIQQVKNDLLDLKKRAQALIQTIDLEKSDN